MRNIGIILGAGVGQRMGSSIPKQYLSVMDREIISFSIEEFRKSKTLDDFFIVSDSQEHAEYIAKKYNVKTILGGKTRNESFSNALEHIRENGGCDNVFVNEAARPMITSELIDTFTGLMRDDVSCVYCVKPITDSLETSDGRFSDRTAYRLVMSPECYDFEVIYKYFDKNSHTTFPGHDIPDTFKKIQYGDYLNNIKVTYPIDLVLLEALLEEREQVSDE